MRGRVFLVVLVSAAWIALLAMPAQAGRPTIVQHQEFDESTPTYVGISCSAFDVLFTATGEQTVIDYYDSAGDLVRETTVFRFSGMLYNGDEPGNTLPYQGRGFVTIFADGTVLNNDMYQVIIDGKPVVLEAANYYDGSQSPALLHGFTNHDVICDPLS